MPTITASREAHLNALPQGRGEFMKSLRLDYLDWMLTDIGLWQHSEEKNPNPRHGYSIDDEARGLIVALNYWRDGRDREFMERLGGACYRFIAQAAVTEGPSAGRFHNFCDAEGKWLDSIGSDDSFGRTLWGLGIASKIDAPFAPKREVDALIQNSLAQIDTLQSNFLRAKAFVVMGLAASRIDDGRLATLADALASGYEATADDDWRWFEPHMTYCNGRLPQAMFEASRLLPNGARYLQIGIASLDFLLDVMRDAKGCYSPIGNARMDKAGWFVRGETRPARWDQQPVDAGALVEACVAAFHATGDGRYAHEAGRAFSWYLGENWHGLPVYDAQTGMVADALHEHGLSRNGGAESVVSVHMAFQALQTLGHK